MERAIRLLTAALLAMILCTAACAEENPSPRAKEQSRTIDIFADALYWYTSETVDWAFILENSPNSETDTFKTFVFDWAPGFRIGLGNNMKHDAWDTQASYTWFQSEASGHAKGSVTSAFLGARLSLLEPFSTGRARLNLHYSMFDGDLGRSFLVSKYLCLRPSIGLKGGWIDQTIHSHWTIPNFFGLLKFTADETLKNRFAGGGPKGGVTGKWCFGDLQKQTLSLIGTFEVGYLWGHWSIKDKFDDVFDTVIRVKTSPRNVGSLLLHAFIGFGWECNFDHNRSHFSAKFGYEIEDWFDQFQIFSDLSGSQTNDLILQGVTLGVRFDF